jgi:hypothetical protein
MFVLHTLLIGISVRGMCMMDSEVRTEIFLGKPTGRRALEKYTCRWNMVERKLRNKGTKTYVQLAEVRTQMGAIGITIMNLRFS